MKVKTSPEEKPKKRGGIQPRNRTKYSALQLNAMESMFLTSQYPDSFAIEELGKSLGVSADRVSIWFQNRRSKFKRQSKDVHMAWMRKQIFNQDAHNQQTSIVSLPRRVGHQSTPDNRHLLSPVEMPISQNPSSIISYMPSMASTATYETKMNTNAVMPGAVPSTSSGYYHTTPSPPTSYGNSSPNSLTPSQPTNDVACSTNSLNGAYLSWNYGDYVNYGTTNYDTPYSDYPYHVNPYYYMNPQQMYVNNNQQPLGV